MDDDVEEPARPRHLAGNGDGATNGRKNRATPAAGATGASGDGGRGAPRNPLQGLLPKLPGWLVPAVLGGAAVAAAAGAFLLNSDETATALGSPATVTPVLSARRAPELIAAPVAGRRLAADLQSWMALSPPDSCLVVEAGDDTLFAHNPLTPLTGASTQKLLTATALLLAKEGPDARLETTVGTVGGASNGVVAGDLFLVGGGDPLLATPTYAGTLNRNHGSFLAVDPVQLVDAIAATGITRIDGSIVGDGSRYDSERYHPTWPGRFAAQSVVGPVGALTVNDGFGLYFDDGLGAGANLTGDPAANAAGVVTQLLRQRGIVVAGEGRSGQAPPDLTTLATFPSVTVREIIAEMLTDSDNDTAEMALKEIGVDESGSGTWAAGAAAATTLLSQAGVTFDGVSIVDGSGLSDTNRLTCQVLVDLLTRPDTGPVLVDGLAVAGETGTLAERWDGTPVEGRLRAKTGTLNTATALSGQVEPLQGGALTFSYVANVAAPGVISPEVVGLQDGLGDILMTYPRGVDIAALVPAAVAASP